LRLSLGLNNSAENVSEVSVGRHALKIDIQEGINLGPAYAPLARTLTERGKLKLTELPQQTDNLQFSRAIISVPRAVFKRDELGL
jgi:hypothetical protein